MGRAVATAVENAQMILVVAGVSPSGRVLLSGI